MRAVVIDEFGPVNSHGLKEIDPPQVSDGEVLIEVNAIGVNFPDALIMQVLDNLDQSAIVVLDFNGGWRW